MSTDDKKYVEVYTGAKFPSVGLGTFLSKPGEVYQAVLWAIQAGYRHIDGAYWYQNEDEVGRAINKAIADGIVKRSDLWVTSKLPGTHQKPSEVRKAFDKTLSDLGLEYLDLYLIHWPIALGTNDKGERIATDDHYIDTWPEMEKIAEAGLAKHIGLSNFNKDQILEVMGIAKIKPAVLQIELHPYLNQDEFITFVKSQKIAVTAYAPLGNPGLFDGSLLTHEKVVAIAKKYKKTAAQICIRFGVERGYTVIPKSVKEHRIKENFDVYDFSLTEDEMKTLLGVNKNMRLYPSSSVRDLFMSSKFFPFDDMKQTTKAE